MPHIIYDVLMLLFAVLRTVILTHFVMSWLINFDVLNIRQPLVAQVWNVLHKTLRPIYRPLERVVPSFGGINFSPVITLIGLLMLQSLLERNIAFFY